jgi:hypothetical protein
MMPWLPFGSSSRPRLLLGIFVKMVAAIPVFFAPLYLVSEVGRHLAITWDQRLAFFLYLFGILVGKGIRFVYWRRRDEWT